MKISIFFDDFMHYHVARCAAVKEHIISQGGETNIYALREKAPDRPIMGDHHLIGEDLRVLNNSKVPVNSWANVHKLISALNQDQPDVVVIPGYHSWPCYAALVWCKVNCRLAVLMSESQRQDYPRTGWREALKRALIKLFDAALVGGTPQVEYARELGLSPEVIFTGYDVVDNLFWQKQADLVRRNNNGWRDKLGLPEKFFVAAKRYIPKKNISGLIKAYALYQSRGGEKAWHLVICGSGPLEGEIRDLIGKLGLQSSVLLPGYKNAEEMAVFYGLASAFVHASSYSEQWGLVVNEAMAAGLPVLVSKICGCAQDLVQEGINGFKFDPYDVEGLARLMLIMSTGEADLKAMGAASQEIISHWTPETFAINLLNAIKAARIAKNRQ
jgi:1,2-diacylglycerol 3-alpha-glucosyltransferase